VAAVYYRLFNRGGEEQSVHSFDTSEPALGRLKRESIAPPRNVLAVKRRIAKAEGKPIYQLADLFTDMTADDARPSDALVDDTCGSSKEKPILIVNPVPILALPHGICKPPIWLWNPQLRFNGLVDRITNSRQPVVMELAGGGRRDFPPRFQTLLILQRAPR
jgi:hypothetical protein